jgi:hypothetical protein
MVNTWAMIVVLQPSQKLRDEFGLWETFQLCTIKVSDGNTYSEILYRLSELRGK